MIIDCISDLHGHYPELEGGDLLIVAGDLTARDKPSEYDDFIWWLDKQSYEKKVLVAGNHDNTFETADEGFFRYVKEHGIDYLCDSGTEFEYDEVEPCLYPSGFFPNFTTVTKKLKIWGSPWTNTFEGINPHCTAFTGNEDLLEEKFALIPRDIDILITHSPPLGFLDMTKRRECVGSADLLGRILFIRPKLCVYGHIHKGYGQIEHNGIKFVNASQLNEDYEPVNAPVRIIL